MDKGFRDFASAIKIAKNSCQSIRYINTSNHVRQIASRTSCRVPTEGELESDCCGCRYATDTTIFLLNSCLTEKKTRNMCALQQWENILKPMWRKKAWECHTSKIPTLPPVSASLYKGLGKDRRRARRMAGGIYVRNSIIVNDCHARLSEMRA